jgi:hypothetical protein
LRKTELLESLASEAVRPMGIRPKYLTINDDLQLIPDTRGHFLSRSGKTLDEVAYHVLGWLEENPTHPTQPNVNAWLDSVDEYREEQNRAIVVEIAMKELEKSVRKCLTIKYRRQGLSMIQARQEASRSVDRVTARLMED